MTSSFAAGVARWSCTLQKKEQSSAQVTLHAMHQCLNALTMSVIACAEPHIAPTVPNTIRNISLPSQNLHCSSKQSGNRDYMSLWQTKFSQLMSACVHLVHARKPAVQSINACRRLAMQVINVRKMPYNNSNSLHAHSSTCHAHADTQNHSNKRNFCACNGKDCGSNLICCIVNECDCRQECTLTNWVHS